MLPMKIMSNATMLYDHCVTNNLPPFSLQSNPMSDEALRNSPAEVRKARINLLDAARDLYQLATGPHDMFRSILFEVSRRVTIYIQHD